MISKGSAFALGVGLLAVFNSPVTLEVGFIWVEVCGSDIALREGTRRGSSLAGETAGGASEFELGGSSGVLASEDSSIELGEAG